jgi:hypothetical protein
MAFSAKNVFMSLTKVRAAAGVSSMGLRGTTRLLLSLVFSKGMIAMYRFALAALMIVIVFDCAKAARIQAPPGIPECHDDARKFCDAVLFDLEKRLACMRAHRSQLSQACIAAIRARR